MEPERDFYAWRSGAGLDCAIVRHESLGHLCGYVRVPWWHPLYRKSYDSTVPAPGWLATAPVGKRGPIPLVLATFGYADRSGFVRLDLLFDVHGSITFSGWGYWAKRSVALRYGRAVLSRLNRGWWLGFDCAHLGDTSPLRDKRFQEIGISTIGDGVYRDVQYVTRECDSLARQIRRYTWRSLVGGYVRAAVRSLAEKLHRA